MISDKELKKLIRKKFYLTYAPPPSNGVPPSIKTFDTLVEAVFYWCQNCRQDCEIITPGLKRINPWKFNDFLKEYEKIEKPPI